MCENLFKSTFARLLDEWLGKSHVCVVCSEITVNTTIRSQDKKTTYSKLNFKIYLLGTSAFVNNKLNVNNSLQQVSSTCCILLLLGRFFTVFRL